MGLDKVKEKNCGPFRIAIVTMSDQGAAGLREDKSGLVIKEKCSNLGQLAAQLVIPDDRAGISSTLAGLADDDRVDLILTTGGTGLSPRDITPEATMDIADRLVPGIPEAMRSASMKKTDRAMLSRAVSVVRGKCLIINLPGSPIAVDECLDVILPVLPHALEILTGRARECARPAEKENT